MVKPVPQKTNRISSAFLKVPILAPAFLGVLAAVCFIKIDSLKFKVNELLQMDAQNQICIYYYKHYLSIFLFSLFMGVMLIFWVFRKRKIVGLVSITIFILYAAILKYLFLSPYSDSISSFTFFLTDCQF